MALRIKSLTVNELIKVLSEDKSFIDLIIGLNTQKQLFDKGIDSTGRSLESIGGLYSFETVKIKNELGQPTDRVTLKDTGDFYESFRVFFRDGNLVITADTIKDTDNLIDRWGADILGLTGESLSVLREKAKSIIIPYVRKKLLTR